VRNLVVRKDYSLLPDREVRLLIGADVKINSIS